MTNTNVGADKRALIPSITGNPLLDTAIRVVLTSASAAITALIVKHLADMGFSDPDLKAEIGAAVFSTLVGAATVTWSIVQTHLNQMSVVQHTVDALATGEVSDAVKVAAMKSSSITDERIILAADNAEAIKANK